MVSGHATTDPPRRTTNACSFVGLGTASNEGPLVTLEVIGPGGRWSRLHPIQVLEGPGRQLQGVVLRPKDKTAY